MTTATPTVPVSDATPSPRGLGPTDVVLLLVLALMWGLSFLFIELALAGLGPISIVAARTFVGSLVLVPILALRRGSLPRQLRTWGHLLLLGTLNNAVPWAAVAWAQQSLPSGLTSLLMALIQTSTLLVSAAIGLERITPARLAGLLLALGGVGLIVVGDVDEAGQAAALLVVMLSTVMYASSAVYAKRTVSGVLPPLTLATGQVLCASLVAVPLALAVEGVPSAEALHVGVLVPVTALGVLGTGLAFLVFYVLIERVGATNATLTTYLVPVVAVLAGAVFLGERLGPIVLAGGGLIGVGIWLSQRRPRLPAEVMVEEPHP